MSKLAPYRIKVLRRRRLSPLYYSLILGPARRLKNCRPGHFVHLGLPGHDVFFRRAMSIAAVDPEAGELEIIFKIFGKGTTILSRMRSGDELDLLGPLGNSFARPRKGETCLMLGGGVGFPPLYFLASRLIEGGVRPGSIEFFYGGRTADEIVERSRIRKLGLKFHPVTDDGSYGESGLVTEAAEKYLASHPSRKVRLYACGPELMLKATDELGLRHGIPGQVSLEAPMPCGIGVCLGCIVPLRAGGYARVCAEGPVFKIGEVEL